MSIQGVITAVNPLRGLVIAQIETHFIRLQVQGIAFPRLGDTLTFPIQDERLVILSDDVTNTIDISTAA